MAWNPFKKKSWQKAGDKMNPNNWSKKAQDELKKPFEEIKRVIDDAEDAIESGADAAVKGVTDTANRAKKDVEGIANKAKREVEKEVNQISDKVEEALTEQLPDLFEKVFVEQLPNLIIKQGPKIVETAVDEVADEIQDIAIEIQQSFAKPGFAMAKKMVHSMHTGLSKVEREKPNLVDHINSVGHSFRLGLIEFRYERVYGRLAVLSQLLDTYVNNPPKFTRTEICACMSLLGPDSVKFTGSISGNIIVVGSKILEIESDFDEISLDLAIEIIDAILEEAGVPEK